MEDRIFTLPRIVFLIVFGYINAKVSAWLAYFGSKPDILHYMVGGVIAFLVLALGLSIGLAYTKKYGSENSDILGEVIGLVISVILELGLIVSIIARQT